MRLAVSKQHRWPYLCHYRPSSIITELYLQSGRRPNIEHMAGFDYGASVKEPNYTAADSHSPILNLVSLESDWSLSLAALTACRLPRDHHPFFMAKAGHLQWHMASRKIDLNHSCTGLSKSDPSDNMAGLGTHRYVRHYSLFSVCLGQILPISPLSHEAA